MKTTRFQKLTLSLSSIIFMLYSITLLFPFFWMLLNSFKGNSEFFQDIWSLPKVWLVENYRSVWNEFQLPLYFFNSIKMTLLGTFLGIASSTTAAYVVAKYDFKLKKLIYGVSVTVLLIPTIGSIAPLYKFMIKTGLINTHIGLLVLYAGGLGFSFLLIYSFFQSISWTYAEAAFVDGATDWQVFTLAMLPQAKGGLAAASLIYGINVWNDYFMPYMFLQDKAKFTLAVALKQISLEQSYSADWPKLFAAMIIATLPIIAVYAIFQKTLIENTVAGGIKG